VWIPVHHQGDTMTTRPHTFDTPHPAAPGWSPNGEWARMGS